jgi:peptide deformylase
MVIDVSEEKNRPLVFVNPEILETRGEQVYQEGCLSVPEHLRRRDPRQRDPGARARPPRPAFEMRVDGLLAVCIQHEMDHLEGKLFVDYLSPLKREMVRKKLAKARRQAAA